MWSRKLEPFLIGGYECEETLLDQCLFPSPSQVISSLSDLPAKE